jgi:O-antigen ligase
MRRRAWNLATGAAWALLLAGSWHDSTTTPLGASALLALALVTCLRPTWGLLLACGLLPLATPLAIVTASPSLVDQLTFAFLTGGFLRLAMARAPVASRLARPALLFGVLIALSGALQLSAIQQRTAGTVVDFLADLFSHVGAHYYAETAYTGVLHSTINWLAALALAVLVERLVRRDPPEAITAGRFAIVGGAALAAFSVVHLAELALASPLPWQTTARAIWKTRFNAFFLDINAAASVYALFLVPALWIAWWGRRRGAWAAALLLGAALWLAGSRAAIASVVAALGLLWARARRPKRRTVAWAAAIACFAVLTLSVVSARNAPVSSASIVRIELTRVALKMTAEHPLFGVGLNLFLPNSVSKISEAAHARYRSFFAHGENAHNNFLQILAELGIFGLGTFLWMLWPAVTGWRTAAPDRAQSYQAGLSAGVVAFLLSSLLGHPLLLDRIRPLFFLMLGLSTGLVPLVAVETRAARAVFGIVLVFIAASAPLRFTTARQSADLAGVVLGATAPRDIGDGTMYRLVAAEGTWYLRPGTAAVELRLMVTDESPAPCTAEIRIDGRQADTVSPTRYGWTPVVYQLNGAGHANRRLDVRVATPRCEVLVAEPLELP